MPTEPPTFDAIPGRRIGPAVPVPVLAADAPPGTCAESRRLLGHASHAEFSDALSRFRRTMDRLGRSPGHVTGDAG